MYLPLVHVSLRVTLVFKNMCVFQCVVLSWLLCFMNVPILLVFVIKLVSLTLVCFVMCVQHWFACVLMMSYIVLACWQRLLSICDSVYVCLRCVIMLCVLQNSFACVLMMFYNATYRYSMFYCVLCCCCVSFNVRVKVWVCCVEYIYDCYNDDWCITVLFNV